jgi:hypothetical protein
MADSRTTYEVMIASPSDLTEEREAAREAIADWNSLHGRERKTMLHPTGWEKDVSPEMGDPQLIINKRLLAAADMLLVFFWTKLGTATERAESGTVEEVKEAVAAGKEVMVYFSDRPADISSIDPKQLIRLNKYKEEFRKLGVYGTFRSPEELKNRLAADLTRCLQRMIEAAKSAKAAEDNDLMTIKIDVVAQDHVRYLCVDVINRDHVLNDVRVFLEYSGTKHELYFSGSRPEPFQPKFSGRFIVGNEEPHQPCEPLANVPPEQINLCVYSGVQQIIRRSATQWLHQFEDFCQPNPNLPARPNTSSHHYNYNPWIGDVSSWLRPWGNR